MRKSTLSIPGAAIVTAICFGLFIVWSVQAVFAGFPAASFSDTGNAWMVGVELILALVALLYLRARGFDIASLYPQPTLRGTLLGMVVFVACWLVGAVVVSVFHSPGQPEVIEFSFAGASLVSRIVLALVNGTFEEVFLLGALVRGLRGFGLSVAVGVPLLIRLLYHVYQGPLGLVWVASFGVTLTASYILSRSLWPSVFAHVLWDVVPTL